MSYEAELQAQFGHLNKRIKALEAESAKMRAALDRIANGPLLTATAFRSIAASTVPSTPSKTGV